MVGQSNIMGTLTPCVSHLSLSSSTLKRGGVWMCELSVISQEGLKRVVKLLLNANRKSYMARRLAQQRMTLSDLEWALHASRAISAVTDLLVTAVNESCS